MKYIIAIISCLSLLPIVAQSESQDNIGRNLFYFEALGAGGLGSINYERVVMKNNLFQTSVRLGLCFNRFKDFRDKFNPDIAIPVNVGIAYGKRFKGELFN